MRQLCNLVCAVQAEALTEDGEFEKWESQINRPPNGYIAASSGWRPRSTIAPELDALMRPSGMGA